MYLPLLSRTKRLKSGLILACPMDDLDCQDIAFNRLPTKFGGTFSLTDGPKGRQALTSPNKASGFTFDAIAGDRLTANTGWSYSISLWYRRDGTSTNYAIPVCYQHATWAANAAVIAGGDVANTYQMYGANGANTTSSNAQFSSQTHIQDRWMHIALSVRCGIALNWTGYDTVTGQTFHTKQAVFDRLPSASGASLPNWTLFNQFFNNATVGWQGALCNVAVWNVALTPEDLQVVRHWDLQ